MSNKKENLLKELNYWEKEYVPTNNIGKWAQQTKINSLKETIKNLENGEIKTKEGSQEKSGDEKSQN